MKKLYLKSGIYFLVKTEVIEAELKPIRTISIFIEDENNEPRLTYLVGDGGFNNQTVATTGGLRFPFWHITAISEIIENFNQYFKNLNQ